MRSKKEVAKEIEAKCLSKRKKRVVRGSPTRRKMKKAQNAPETFEVGKMIPYLIAVKEERLNWKLLAKKRHIVSIAIKRVVAEINLLTKERSRLAQDKTFESKGKSKSSGIYTIKVNGSSQNLEPRVISETNMKRRR